MGNAPPSTIVTVHDSKSHYVTVDIEDGRSQPIPVDEDYVQQDSVINSFKKFLGLKRQHNFIASDELE
jgi:hypothetical protein